MTFRDDQMRNYSIKFNSLFVDIVFVVAAFVVWPRTLTVIKEWTLINDYVLFESWTRGIRGIFFTYAFPLFVLLVIAIRYLCVGRLQPKRRLSISKEEEEAGKQWDAVVDELRRRSRRGG